MAIGQNHLTTNGTATGASSFSTSSVAPSSNSLVCVALQSSFGAVGGNTPETPTGNSITYQLLSQFMDSGGVHFFSLWIGTLTSPSASAITFTFGGQTQTYAWWSVAEFTGVNSDGSDPGDAIGQFEDDEQPADTNFDITLAAFGAAGNATYLACGTPALRTFTAGTDFTLFGQAGNVAGQGSIASEFRLANDTSPNITMSSASTMMGTAIEVVELVAVTGRTRQPRSVNQAVSRAAYM